MKLLAIDTSTSYLSLAVVNDGKTLSRYHKKADMKHSSLLIPTIDKVLSKARIRLSDIDGFSVSIGPGSFTGLRIAVTTVKGLAYAMKKKIVVVPALDVIAANAVKSGGIICPVLDARKKKVYACIYKSDGKSIKRLSKYMLLGAEDLDEKLKKYEDVLFLGDAVEQVIHSCRGRLNVPYKMRCKTWCKAWHPKAEIVARMGLELFKKRRFVKPEDLEPFYIYSKECDITGR